MPKYVKKPIVVEAKQFFPDRALPEGVWMTHARTVDASRTRGIIYDVPARYELDTQHGTVVVEPGDWIITGLLGEKYPCRDALFRLTHELVEINEGASVSNESWEHLTDRN